MYLVEISMRFDEIKSSQLLQIEIDHSQEWKHLNKIFRVLYLDEVSMRFDEIKSSQLHILVKYDKRLLLLNENVHSPE